MKTKRIFSAAVTLLLAAGLALSTGCADGEQPDTSGGTSSGAEAGEDSLLSVLKFEPDPNLDLEGRELTIAVWGTVPERGVSTKYDRRYALSDRTEEKYHVKFNWIASKMDTFVQDYSLAYTSGTKYADIMFCPSENGFAVAKLTNSVVPLDDYIDYSSPYYKLTGENLRFVDGKHYSYMPDELTANSLGYFIIYNTTLLDAANCEDPMTLYNEGRWDWDAFAEIVQKTTVTQDGEVTQWGVGGSNLVDALLLSNGTRLVDMDLENNVFTCGLYNDAGQHALEFLRRLTYDYKGCDGQYGGDNSILTFRDNRLAMLVSAQYYGGNFVSLGMPIGTVPMPKGPDAGGYVNGLDIQEWWMLPSISDFEVEEVLQVAMDMNENDPAYEDTYIAPEAQKDNFVVQTYDEGVFTTEEEAEFFYDFIYDENVKTVLNITSTDITSTVANEVFGPISNGQDPRGLLESVKPVIDAALERLLPESMK